MCNEKEGGLDGIADLSPSSLISLTISVSLSLSISSTSPSTAYSSKRGSSPNTSVRLAYWHANCQIIFVYLAEKYDDKKTTEKLKTKPISIASVPYSVLTQQLPSFLTHLLFHCTLPIKKRPVQIVVKTCARLRGAAGSSSFFRISTSSLLLIRLYIVNFFFKMPKPV